MLRRTPVLLIGVLLIGSGCGDSDTAAVEDTPTTAAATNSTTAAATTTTTTTTTTAAPPTTTTTAPPTTTTLPPVPAGLDVIIESDWVLADDSWVGTFVATGPAVEAGAICPTGGLTQGAWDDSVGTYRGDMILTCADGTGEIWITYTLKGEYTDEGYGETGTWVVGIGTGAHEALIGNGTDVTTSPEINTYVSISKGRVAIADG